MQRLRLKHTHLNYFQFILRSLKILGRYGLSTRKMEAKLDQYLEILGHYHITPTFPITGRVLKNHPHIGRKLSKNGIELAVHGYQHIDHTRLSQEELLEHLGRAVELFHKNDIFFSGFRFPYLKVDEKCMDALNKHSFEWDSSYTIYWDVIGDMIMKKKNWRNYENMLAQYNYRKSSTCLSVPRHYDKLLEVPISLPDDDLLERGGIKDNGSAIKVWGEILRQTHSRGELFTLQLHPERIHIFKEALVSIIESSRQLFPKVWVANLRSVYEWWDEKRSFSAKLNSKLDGEYEVDVKCSPRATILIRSNESKNGRFDKGFDAIKERRFLVKSPKHPVIGIREDSSPKLIEFLKNEGFIFEASENKDEYSLYLDNFREFSEDDEMKALEIIHESNLPLIRFWRWPDDCQSALTITGDIDALTSVDFFSRLFG